MVGRRGTGHAGVAHPLLGDLLVQLLFRDAITDFSGGFVNIEVEFFHRAHAIFVIIDRRRLRCMHGAVGRGHGVLSCQVR
ncbi:hypothetical protein D9M73_162350 [compost metagenome]